MAGTSPTWSLEYASDGNAREQRRTGHIARPSYLIASEGAAMDPKNSFRKVLADTPTRDSTS